MWHVAAYRRKTKREGEGGREREREREKLRKLDRKLTFEPVSEGAIDASQGDEKDVEQFRHCDVTRKREKDLESASLDR